MKTERPTDCAACGAEDVSESIEVQSFRYGVDRFVTLTAAVPVMRCHICDTEYTDSRAEDARAEAVKQFLASAGPDWPRRAVKGEAHAD